MEGMTGTAREIAAPAYLPTGDPSSHGGGSYTRVGQEPTIEDYERVFGPAARDIKRDPERNRRRQRLHLPDVLQGPNPWLTDRVDGLITDTSNSPFTSVILPYKHIDNVDGKIKWNVWSFDEGMASRVPYESSARVLTQTKRSFAGYTVRQGLAISMEANFMMTPEGRENFKNQLMQVVGSIQQTNDLDVHVALLQAPSYQQTVNEKYFASDKTKQQLLREYVDLFGFLQKNPNALDIAIEEAKDILRSWGAKDPTFMLCNSKLTMQLTMTPERTQYFTQGYDGVKRLKQGPELGSYRGLKIIHSRAFSIETGARPRDLLNRRVRVAEYYRIPWHQDNPKRTFQFYDESRDSWFTMSWNDLLRAAALPDDEDVQSNNKRTAGLYNTLNNIDWNHVDQRVVALPGAKRALLLPPHSLPAYGVLAKLNFDAGVAAARINIVVNGALNVVAVLPEASPTSKWFQFFMTAKLTEDMVDVLLEKGDNNTDVQRAIAMVFQLHNAFAAPGGGAAGIVTPIGDFERVDRALLLVFASLMTCDDDEHRILSAAVKQRSLAQMREIHDAILRREGERFRKHTTVGRRDLLCDFTDKVAAARDDAERHTLQNGEGTFELFLYAMCVRLFGTNRFDDFEIGNTLVGANPGGAGVPVNTCFTGAWENMTSFFRVVTDFVEARAPAGTARSAKHEIVILRPNIEHNMLGVILGRGGLDDLGGTLWGQTQLECYSDSMHGLWGMSYKYNERAIVWNEKNLIRLWDICYGSYSGGKDSRLVDWSEDGVQFWQQSTNATHEPYQGPSMAVMSFEVDENDVDWVRNWPSPISYHSNSGNSLPCDPDNLVRMSDREVFTMWGLTYRNRFAEYQRKMPNFTDLHLCNKVAGEASFENVASVQSALAFQGSMRVLSENGSLVSEVHGCGHHGPDYVGVASRRNGKGMTVSGRAGIPVFGAI